MNSFNEPQMDDVTYCINPKCKKRENPEYSRDCQACGTPLFINDRYQLIKPLRELNQFSNSEIFELKDWGIREKDYLMSKILKVKRDSSHVELFEREARILMTLKHPGIPKVNFQGYFTISVGKNSQKLHCLVMEKIEGQNLQQWLQENESIPEKLAIDWLKQLAEILDYIHKKSIFHRDIKPSNIMVRPNGKLALIDFGTAEEVTPTYINNLQNQQVIPVISDGYTPPEQIGKKAVLQSDFFALGRTLVYLLTGRDPNVFQTDATGKLIWRNSAPKVSKFLADLIDDLMATSPENRPQSAKVILERLSALVPKPKVKLEWRDLPVVFLGSILVTSAVMGVRWFGVLQPLELEAYDRFMRSRPPDRRDSRILVVEISQRDINNDGGYPLKDATLAKAIKNLEQYEPTAIGLNLHRYQKRLRGTNDLTGSQEFINRFKNNPNFFLVCSYYERSIDYQPPDEFSQGQLISQVGLSDLLPDEPLGSPIRTVRRQWLSYEEGDGNRRCITKNSLSLQLAQQFLRQEGKSLTLTGNGEWHYNQVIFKILSSRIGGYQNIPTLDGQSNQIFINYRSGKINSVTIGQVLEGKVDSNLIKNQIILIGYAPEISADIDFNTPLGKMSGVWIQAHMTSQILSAVLDGRSLLWVLPQWKNFQWGDAIFILICSCTSGLLGCCFRSILHLSLLSGAGIWLLYGICLMIFIQGGWMPLVPSTLSFVTTGGSLFVHTVYRTSRK